MNAKIKIIAAMLIFGSIGIFVKQIDLSSSQIAFLRGVIGSTFLFVASFFVKQRISFTAVKKNGLLLFLSGAAIGLNWIFLFQSYKYTTIAIATLSYYFAPIFVMILAPLILRERLTSIKVVCIITAMIGLGFIVNPGAISADSTSYNHTVGILYGLVAAVLYASVILMNKFIKNVSGYETTLVQLILAAIVLLPYILAKEGLSFSGLHTNSVIMILIVGIIHTGIAYFLYFSAVKELKGQTIAVLSYIDPISAVIFAAIFLKESMSFLQIVGGILILCSTFISERFEQKS